MTDTTLIATTIFLVTVILIAQMAKIWVAWQHHKDRRKP